MLRFPPQLWAPSASEAIFWWPPAKNVMPKRASITSEHATTAPPKAGLRRQIRLAFSQTAIRRRLTCTPTVHVFNGLPSYTFTFYPTLAEGREITTEVRRPDDLLLRRTVQEWQNRVTLPWWSQGEGSAPPTDPRLIRATTHLENGTTSSKTEYDYL